MWDHQPYPESSLRGERVFEAIDCVGSPGEVSVVSGEEPVAGAAGGGPVLLPQPLLCTLRPWQCPPCSLSRGPVLPPLCASKAAGRTWSNLGFLSLVHCLPLGSLSLFRFLPSWQSGFGRVSPCDLHACLTPVLGSGWSGWRTFLFSHQPIFSCAYLLSTCFLWWRIWSSILPI